MIGRWFKTLLIALAVCFELFFVLNYNPYPHGEMSGVRYRHSERMAAFIEYQQHPSPETKATLDEEMRLMHNRALWKGWIVLTLVIAANLAVLYLLSDRKKRAAAT